MGDGVLIYFGYPQAHEDDAERAVMAGIELQRELDRFGEQVRSDYDLTLAGRVAIEAGRVTDPDDQAWMDDRLTAHPWACFEQKLVLTNEDALWALPRYSIVCTSTLLSRSPKLMDEYRSKGRLWDIDTGHDLMITEPKAVADMLLSLATR